MGPLALTQCRRWATIEPMLRNIYTAVSLLSLVALATGADGGGVISGNGEILRNGAKIVGSSAVLAGDLIETRANSVANLTSVGSSVLILPDSFVEFQGQSLSIEHGSVRVATSHGISVRVRCTTIVPTSSAWTQFEVTDVNGNVEVAAKKNNVRIETVSDSIKKEVAERSNDLREGEQATRDESTGCKEDKRKGGGALPAGSGGVLRSEYVKYGAVTGVGILGLFLTLDQDDPASPYKP
jgi:hypothetical protein